MNDANSALEEVFRREHGLVLASLVRTFGDFDLAEEALADAMAAGLEAWPKAGVPDNPAAWLLTVSKRKGIDRLRRQRTLQEKLPALIESDIVDALPDTTDGIPDERLQLIFACCHPALSPEGRVGLTLKSLGGLTTAEVARAFLVSEATMSQRLTRAKNKIRLAGIPVEMPETKDLPDRLESVLAVIYLIFNEGYFPLEGEDLVKVDLCVEAIRLAGMMTDLMPAEGEVWALAALCWLTEARRPARLDATGAMVLLEDQDRSLWNQDAIGRGLECLDRAAASGGQGQYLIQAEIAAAHSTASTTESTDWSLIIDRYQRLYELKPSPVVALNLAVAHGLAHGSEVGLDLMVGLEGPLDGYQPFHASRAELLARSGRAAEAVDEFERALSFPMNDVQRRHLERRLAEMT